MANLRLIKSVISASVEVTDENGTGTGVFFELAGPTHPKRKAINFASARKAQANFKKAGEFELDDPEELVVQSRTDLAALTLGWTNFTDDAGAPVPFTTEAAAALYQDDEYAWLADQMQAGLNKKNRFMKRSVPA